MKITFLLIIVGSLLTAAPHSNEKTEAKRSPLEKTSWQKILDQMQMDPGYFCILSHDDFEKEKVEQIKRLEKALEDKSLGLSSADVSPILKKIKTDSQGDPLEKVTTASQTALKEIREKKLDPNGMVTYFLEKIRETADNPQEWAMNELALSALKSFGPMVKKNSLFETLRKSPNERIQGDISTLNTYYLKPFGLDRTYPTDKEITEFNVKAMKERFKKIPLATIRSYVKEPYFDLQKILKDDMKIERVNSATQETGYYFQLPEWRMVPDPSKPFHISCPHLSRCHYEWKGKEIRIFVGEASSKGEEVFRISLDTKTE